MSVLPELLEANARFADGFSGGDLEAAPRRRVVILTCMDARLDPVRALGLEPGDAHILRNAGGRAAEALRSLVISQRMLGTREVVVIHHTRCGMQQFTNEELRAKVVAELGPEAGAASAEIDFLPVTDVEQSVREDVALLRTSPLIPDDVLVHGFVYDVGTGRLTPVA